MTDKRDLLILGGGLVGMTLAMAAAKKGLSSHLVDRADPAELTAEGFPVADLIRVTQWFFDNDKPIASVCHGVEIPAYADCVRGRRMATVPKCKFDLEVCGGIFVNEPCVVDGNLVSGRTFHDNGHYIGPWIELLQKARSSVNV